MKERRFRFLTDDDGHTYVVPVGEEKDFEIWLENGPYWENYEGPEYQSIGCAPSCYTFTDPRED